MAKIKKKPKRFDLKKKPANDHEEIERIKYVLDKIAKANKMDIDWK